MIRPDMATMLAFITTDASVDREWLQQCLESAVDKSFNSITIDGDTSTNDACVLAATGASATRKLAGNCDSSVEFQQAVDEVFIQLAQSIVRDGEGATKFVTVHVESAVSIDEAKQVAYTVAHSPLVKTALFASDANWGRILAAVGRAGVPGLDVSHVNIDLDDVRVVTGGERDAGYQDADGQRILAQDKLSLNIDLGRGLEKATVWTCDLSHDYVRINAEYRT